MMTILVAFLACAPSNPLDVEMKADVGDWLGDDAMWSAINKLTPQEQTLIAEYMKTEGMRGTSVPEGMKLGDVVALERARAGQIDLGNTFSDPRRIAKALYDDLAIRKAARDDVESRPRVDAGLMGLEETNNVGMVYIPAGVFVEGRFRMDPGAMHSEPEAHLTDLTAYMIDRYQYPNIEGQVSMTAVDLSTAVRLCTEQGKRLCTASEWEKACKGPLNTIYAYTTDTDNIEQTATVCPYDKVAGENRKCKSRYGVYDLSDAVPEWTGSVVKGFAGGVPRCSSEWRVASDRTAVEHNDLGFRCCRDVGQGALPVMAPTEGEVNE